MGPGGYAFAMPKWDKLEADFLARGITPEPCKWVERARNWFYGHGGTLDAEGKCIYNRRHKDNPLLPIEDIRNAVKDVEEGRSVPIERRTSSHAPLGMKNTKDEHEAQKAPSHGQLGFPRTGRSIPIEVIRGERKGRQWKHALLQTGYVI